MCVNPLVKIVAHMHYSAVFAESVQLLEDEAEADFLPLDCVFVSRFLNSCLQQELMVRGWASVSHTPPPSHTHTHTAAFGLFIDFVDNKKNYRTTPALYAHNFFLFSALLSLFSLVFLLFLLLCIVVYLPALFSRASQFLSNIPLRRCFLLL